MHHSDAGYRLLGKLCICWDRGQSAYGKSILFAQFHCEPETTVKSKMLKKKKNIMAEWCCVNFLAQVLKMSTSIVSLVRGLLIEPKNYTERSSQR